MAFALYKIFAVSTAFNSDTQNTETNINYYDIFSTMCFKTYRGEEKRGRPA